MAGENIIAELIKQRQKRRGTSVEPGLPGLSATIAQAQGGNPLEAAGQSIAQGNPLLQAGIAQDEGRNPLKAGLRSAAGRSVLPDIMNLLGGRRG